ncbi:MAG: hypothetical protein R3300_18705 [Candidatus Promineifilaceae bacterium]|nr:hypothetical protein [Candidatus Promineifilaceae bacterium]
MEKMVQKMMTRYRLFIGMGFMIVIVAVIIGAFNTANAATYYAVDKATRDASSELAQLRAGIESTIIWLPYFKFLGVAMILSGITMALGVIAAKLEKLGREVMSSVPQQPRVSVPARPHTVKLMRMFMMLGMLVIVVGFIGSLITAGTAASVYSHSVSVIDAAPTSSALLQDLQSVHATETWLEAFKFVGVAFFFLGIINGLSTIIFALRYQKKAIPEVVERLSEHSVPAPAVGD